MQQLKTIIISFFLFACFVSCQHEIIYNGSDIYMIPKDAPHKETLIYLHGVGGSAQIMLDHLFTNYTTMFARNSTKVVLLTAPTANVTVSGKAMTSWFDIITFKVEKEFDLNTAFNLTDIMRNSLRIKQAMHDEIKILGGDSTKLFIGGFSQGCFMSLYSGLTFNKTIGGILGSSGYLVSIPESDRLNGANANIPLYLSHGKNDTTIYYELAETIYRDRLSPLAHKITKVYEDGVGHAITETMKVRERQWFFDQTQPKKEQAEDIFLPILY